MQISVHVLDESDTVGIALRPIASGESVFTERGGTLQVTSDIAKGHKVALTDITEGQAVTKYGHQIGTATADIHTGDHVHVHNLAFSAHEKPTADMAGTTPTRAVELPDRRTFMGYKRPDGTVATRNYIAIISTVNCSATVSRMVATQAEAWLAERYPSIDGVIAVTHEAGCAAVASSRGVHYLRRTLAGYATHPNVGGVVIIGLGCELNLISTLLEHTQFTRNMPVTKFNIQDVGGTRRAVESGLDAIRDMAPTVADVRRVNVPVSALTVGLECGGSDGWSGVTANPALGYASDLIAAQGGRTTLAEAPEVYGAEDLLVRRATSPQVAQKLLDQLAWWESYVAADGGTMNNNPSPGNIAGGITTILEKSLGAAAKGGHAPMTAVYDYAEKITEPGFSFMNTPGYDPVSVTGLVAGGANIICFTTGRGSASGSRPAPTIKLSTNTETYNLMPEDMDINCGDIVDEGVSISTKGLEIYNAILDVASGKQTLSEGLGYGNNEITPWHIGAVM